MGNAIRVLHVINTAEVGGGGEHLIALTRGLFAHGFSSTALVGRDGPSVARLRDGGVPVEVMGGMGFGATARITRSLERARPDLLHLHGSRSGYFGAIAARRARVRPVVYTAHALSFHRAMPFPLRWLAARAERGTSRRVDRVIALTRGDLEAARGRGIMNATVIPNGIDPARFAATTDRRAELGIPDSAPVVGMIARLVPQKDPATFARAAVIAARANPEMRFVLAGDGPLRASVEEEARDLIERRRWISTGFRSDVPELLATLDVVVFPSRWEGLPLTLLEAMAASRAVVASELPGHAEVIRSGENGVLIPAGDAAALAREMSRLIAEPQRRMAMGVEARAHVERHHTVERMVERTAELYRSLLGSSTALEGGVAAPEPERQAE